MTKMKTVKAIKARFSATGTKKLKHGRPGKRHLLSGKSPKRKRQLAKANYLHKSKVKTYSQLIGV